MAIEEKEEQTTSLKDLIELIEKDPLPSNVFTIEDKDPMVILGKLNEVIAYLKTLQATINSSDDKANQALENAINALSSASDSLQASTIALNSSNKALETANLAIDTANTSLAGSNEAKTSSSEALANANNALQIAQEALNQVTESLGSKVYDNNGNLMNNVKFAGDNGINVDLGEDNQTIEVRLDETITKAIEDNHTAIEQTKAQANANQEDINNLTELLGDIPSRVENVETNLSEINPKVARALLTPMTTPSELKLVGIDTSNSQEMINVGETLQVNNGEININYPVGAIYLSVNNTSPASIFGGTWEKIENKFLLSSGSDYLLGETGGEANHMIKQSEMARLKVPYSTKNGTDRSMFTNNALWTNGLSATWLELARAEEQTPMPIMPPYLVINVWKRVG